MTERRKTAVVTGSTRGLGLQIATRLTDSDWDLVLLTRRPEACAKLFPEALIVPCNLADPGATAEALKAKSISIIDALVNCAAVRNTKKFEERTLDSFLMEIMIGLISPMALVLSCWPGLKAAKGIIVNINSVASESPGRGECGYAAAKAGLRGFSKAMQFGATVDGVQVVDVVLGAMSTDMTKKRADHAQLIDPNEAAEIIVERMENKKESCRVTEIKILRSRYS